MEWSRFGLDRQPFRAAVDLDSYFPSPSHDAAVAAIAAAYGRRDAIALLDGVAGVGKSLLARKWLGQLPPEAPRVLVPNARAERPADLLQAILFDLGLPFQGLSEQELRLAATARLLDSAAQSGQPTVILLDEAQSLGPPALEELRLLSNLETRGGIAVFALLVAQTNLRAALATAESELLAQRIAAAPTIEFLTADESTGYLLHQLTAAGGDASAILPAEAAAVLAVGCGGIPRNLNRAGALALGFAAGGEADEIDVEAALAALEQLGLPTDAGTTGATEAILLPHPAQSAGKSRGKASSRAGGDEAAPRREPKDKGTRKRAA